MPIRAKVSLSLAMALSGLERSEWEDFESLYDEGAQIVRQASCSPTNSNLSQRTSPSVTSTESGIASISSEYCTPPLLSDDDLFYKLEDLQIDGAKKIQKYLESLDNDVDSEIIEQKKKADDDEPYPVNNSQILWKERNILELYGNLKGNGNMFTTAVISKGVQNYFKNRSQISRIQGAPLPYHQICICKDEGCNFVEHKFS